MGLTFQRETVADMRPDADDLVTAHYREAQEDPHGYPLEMDWSMCRALCSSGHLYVWTVRDNGALRGYAVGVRAPSIFARTVSALSISTFYVCPSARRGMAALRLFRTIEEDARDMAIHRLCIGFPSSKPYGNLFARLGYHVTETRMEKAI